MGLDVDVALIPLRSDRFRLPWSDTRETSYLRGLIKLKLEPAYSCSCTCTLVDVHHRRLSTS